MPFGVVGVTGPDRTGDLPKPGGCPSIDLFQHTCLPHDLRPHDAPPGILATRFADACLSQLASTDPGVIPPGIRPTSGTPRQSQKKTTTSAPNSRCMAAVEKNTWGPTSSTATSATGTRDSGASSGMIRIAPRSAVILPRMEEQSTTRQAVSTCHLTGSSRTPEDQPNCASADVPRRPGE